MAKTLTGRQRAFVESYLIKGCATQAAIAAGYSVRAAGPIGSRLLTNANIAAEIQARQAAVTEAVNARLQERIMSGDQVLVELSDLAHADLGDFLKPVEDADGNVHYVVDLAKAMASGKTHHLKKVKWTEWGPEIEVHARLGPLRVLAQHHGLLKEQVQVDANVNVTAKVDLDEATIKAMDAALIAGLGYGKESNTGGSTAGVAGQEPAGVDIQASA